jgi:LysR family transcriptional regulator, nitrogen assimilation regulatory protein
LFVTWLVAKPKMRALSIAAQRFYEAICDMGREQIRANIWQPPT